MKNSEQKKYKKAIKGMLGNIFGENANDIFEANFPKISKEEQKKEDDREFVENVLDWAINEPHRVTAIRAKKFTKITGIRMTPYKKPKTKK